MTNERAIELVEQVLTPYKDTDVEQLARVYLSEDILSFDADQWILRSASDFMLEFVVDTSKVLDELNDKIFSRNLSVKEMLEVQADKLLTVMMTMAIYAKAHETIFDESQRWPPRCGRMVCREILQHKCESLVETKPHLFSI